MKLRCVAGQHVLDNKEFKVIRTFCESYRYTLEVEFNTSSLMLESKGRCNPDIGFIVYFLGKPCYDIFDLIRCIEGHGYIPA